MAEYTLIRSDRQGGRCRQSLSRLTRGLNLIDYRMADYRAYDDTVKLLALARYGRVGPRLLDLLMRQLVRLDAVFELDRKGFSHIEGLNTASIERILSSRDRLKEAKEFMDVLRGRDITVISRHDESYPQHLFELNDSPVLLYCRGHLPDPKIKSVVLMGADTPTAEGIEMTSRLSRLFSQAGVQMVAPLSGGIAAAAHLAAKASGVASYAVVEFGFDAIVGSVEMSLAIDIAATGGVVSEFAPDDPPARDAIGQANRLMVGLVRGVVFTEMYADSARAQDMIEFCNQTGKLTFFFVDPELGALSDKQSLERAVENGAIPLTGYDKVPDIVNSLV